ncbi:MAG TPA: AbrB/MazE/SpoVT family DNA-binding domain-containing protein [Terriglobia bacterium]|nr:AbrB/MazE/SpoVT family DNA-binding domain-containing protein [Terriglobia bacterium]
MSYLHLTFDAGEVDMETTRLSSKGQVILPKSVRDARSWQPGTKFAVEEVADGVLLRPMRHFEPARFDEVFGCLRHRGRPKTLREMKQAISRGVRDRHDRGRY